MDLSERRARIRSNLGIEPINHGQIYTFQIAIPESEKEKISAEQRLLIEESLTQHKSNLMPLIVRRTQAYSEEEEYEVIYDAAWCLVAKELDIEKLWVWVFDMTDEQAVATKEEMKRLVDSSSSLKKTNEETDIGSLIEQKLRPIYTKMNQLMSNSSGNSGKLYEDEKLRGLESKLEILISTVHQLIVKVDNLVPTKLNLKEAKEEEIQTALEDAGVKYNQIKAILEAIRYWKNPDKGDKGLTWSNLKESIKSKEHKIKDFGQVTYEKLKAIADISNN